MVGLLIFIFIVVLACGALSGLFGVDSRDGLTDPRWPNTPVGLS